VRVAVSRKAVNRFAGGHPLKGRAAVLIGGTDQVEAIDDARLDDAGVQSQQNELRIEIVTGHKCVVYSAFDLKRELVVV